MRTFGLILLVIFALQPIAALCQEDPNSDQEFWTGFTYKLKLNKKWRAEAEQQLRFNDNWSDFKLAFTEIGLRYKLLKGVDAKLQYRFTSIAEQRNDQRWSLDIRAEYDIKNIPLDILYRFRFQDEKVYYTGEKNTQIRNMIGLDYNLSKLVDPFLKYESFYRLNTKNEFRTDRFTLGLNWKLNDDWSLESFYRLDRQKNVRDPEDQYVFAMRFTYSQKLKKSSK